MPRGNKIPPKRAAKEDATRPVDSHSSNLLINNVSYIFCISFLVDSRHRLLLLGAIFLFLAQFVLLWSFLFHAKVCSFLAYFAAGA